MNDKKISEAIEQLKGKVEPTEEQLEKMKGIADKYSNKSDREILFDIINLNKQMTENMSAEEYREKIEMLEKLSPMLDEDQRKKLEMILKVIKK